MEVEVWQWQKRLRRRIRRDRRRDRRRRTIRIFGLDEPKLKLKKPYKFKQFIQKQFNDTKPTINELEVARFDFTIQLKTRAYQRFMQFWSKLEYDRKYINGYNYDQIVDFISQIFSKTFVCYCNTYQYGKYNKRCILWHIYGKYLQALGNECPGCILEIEDYVDTKPACEIHL